MENQSWTNEIPENQWRVYARALDAFERQGLPRVLGGAFALAHYTGVWRNTKDMDLYVLPEQKEDAIAALHQAGLKDYFSTYPYDRNWIFRSHDGETIVDVIWAMANQRAQIDEGWIESPVLQDIRGYTLRVCPIEELIWAKLFVMQRERCDWPDIVRLLHHHYSRIDWNHLLARVGDDRALLSGVLSLFRWLAPHEARLIDAEVWAEAYSIRPRSDVSAEAEERQVIEAARLLDSRPWFF